MPEVLDLLLALALLSLLATPYLVYPALLRLLPVKPRSVAHPPLERLPTVSVLVPAHNEAGRIAAKIENVLGLQYPADKLQVLVASDGSADATAAIARRYEPLGVRVYEHGARGGKTRALNHLLEQARGELVMFTDVGSVLEPQALLHLVSAFEDATVGVAVPRYVAAGSTQGGAGAEASYWRRETALKRLEAERDVLLGAHGACYLVRRSALSKLPEDTIHDDFVWPLSVRAQGARIVYLDDVHVHDEPPRALSTTFHRTARIAQGNLQMLVRHRALLHPRHGRVALGLWAHKALKTLGPLWIALLWSHAHLRAAASPAFAALAILGDVVLACCAAGAVWAWSGRALPASLARGAHALVAQLACAAGLARFALGAETVRWKRPPENELLDLARPAPPPWSVRIAKRALDVLGASVALLLLWPVMALVAIAVALESKGPVIYRQERLAFDGTGRAAPFTMWKFRSMRQDAERDGRAVWAQERDPRITRVGAFLRKTRLDELPQLMQVLIGQMSLVGPRPERPQIASELETTLPGYGDRLLPCKPGITGWAQIHTGYDTSVDSVREKLLYDFTYNAHLYDLRSYLAMELRVVIGTLSVVAFGRGAR